MKTAFEVTNEALERVGGFTDGKRRGLAGLRAVAGEGAAAGAAAVEFRGTEVPEPDRS